jgi:UDP-glucose 4-epimerase
MSEIRKVLVTGGAGYIGSHTCVLLLNAGYEVLVMDNLINSKYISLELVQKITGKKLVFIEGDLMKRKDIASVFKQYKIDAVIHFAGLKAVAESVTNPLSYYQNNILGTLNLLEKMQRVKVKNIVFSSSTTVYAHAKNKPLKEDSPLFPTNPYGRSKLFIESILQDVYLADSDWNVSILRYFNPVGAHKSGAIGEDPNGIPNNLMPFIAQAAVGRFGSVSIFGNDYKTVDGTGVRDYIHVIDLAKGHISAILKLNEKPGLMIHNLGTGKGYSVLEVIKAFEKASGKKIPNTFEERRAGDVAICYADVDRANEELAWEAEECLDSMCVDTWRWQSKNPDGYTSGESNFIQIY